MIDLPKTPSFRLDGRRALVTGGSSGIGLGCAVALAEAGANVTVMARKQAALEEVMTEDPSYWQGHYSGDEAALFHQRHFGLADRIRYYWPQPKAQKAVQDLLEVFDGTIKDSELIKVFDAPVLARAEGLKGTQVQRLIDAEIQNALLPYFFEEAA